MDIPKKVKLNKLIVEDNATYRGYFQGIAPTGRQITIADIFITCIKEGKVVELWAQFDALGLLQQLGVFPLIGSSPMAN